MQQLGSQIRVILLAASLASLVVREQLLAYGAPLMYLGGLRSHSRDADVGLTFDLLWGHQAH